MIARIISCRFLLHLLQVRCLDAAMTTMTYGCGHDTARTACASGPASSVAGAIGPAGQPTAPTSHITHIFPSSLYTELAERQESIIGPDGKRRQAQKPRISVPAGATSQGIQYVIKPGVPPGDEGLAMTAYTTADITTTCLEVARKYTRSKTLRHIIRQVMLRIKLAGMMLIYSLASSYY